jgi:hypothetical protein
MNTSRKPKVTIVALLLAAVFVLALASPASAFKVISEPGEGAGQTEDPSGLAVNYETGRLYVADDENNRIDVFDAAGNFEKAFGWGVKNGNAQLQVCTSATTCRTGLPGSGRGQFGLSRPNGIAVDNSCFLHDPPLTEATVPTCEEFDPANGNLYVADSDNNRVQEFDPEGNFILTFGGGVDKTVPGNVCTAASGHTCGAGSAGSKEGEFALAISVGVGPDGVVDVFDDYPTGPNQSRERDARVQRFEASGVEIVPQQVLLPGKAFFLGTFAVDSASGAFYVGRGGAISKYESGNSAAIGEFQDPFEDGLGEDGLGAGAQALATDSEGHLFAAQTGNVSFDLGAAGISIIEFDSAGNRLRLAFGTYSDRGFGTALAPFNSASGDIYAAEYGSAAFGSRVLQLDFPPLGPLIFPEPCKADPLGNTKGTLKAFVVPEGKATTYHVELIDDATFRKDVAEAGAGHGFDHAQRVPKLPAEDEVLPADFKVHEAAAGAELAPSTEYHCRVVASNADGTASGEEGTFTSLPPLEFGSGWSSQVGTEAATLNAEVNPLGIPTTGYFQYVDESTYQEDVAALGPEHGFDHALKVPAGSELEFGGGEGLKAKSAEISGLAPGGAYRWRLVATDAYFPEGLPGAVHTLRTFAPGEGGLPDGRAYELVSPAQKNSAEVGVPGPAGGLYLGESSLRIQAAADSGEAIAYTSWTSFGDAKSGPSSSQYLSKRGPSGWGTENLSHFGFLHNPLRPPYLGFTPDLGFSAFYADKPPLTPEAQDGFQNLYLRDNATGRLQALTIEEPQNQGAAEYCTAFAGASADGTHAIFAASGAMAAAKPGAGFNLYEWSAAGGLRLASVFPNEEAAPPVDSSKQAGEGTGFGAAGGNCRMGIGIVRHAISEDGSVVFWRYGGKYKGAERPLFARIDGVETIQLDAKPEANAGKGPFGNGRFWAATGDGSKAFFTAPGRLTADAEAAGHLYRYDTQSRTLIDLTPGATEAKVQGVIGASEDGAYAYFVAKGALSEDENAGHQKAKDGANNLYLWHQGEGLRFIGALSSSDYFDWESAPEHQAARLSPDGRYLAFTSTETGSLSGYDNTKSTGTGCDPRFLESVKDPHCPEAYLYSVDTDTLICASCNPTGARPAGPTQLPTWSNPYEGPRYLSDDGSRLFFESSDALNITDENGRRDVYEFERAGSGACGVKSPEFDPTSGGCQFLISSGKSSDESYLLDASSDGRDVFFSTRQSLLGWDANENYDVYDAREGGGFTEPEEIPSCAGEGCKPPPTVPPASTAPFTPTFQGPGNQGAKRKKHKAKKHKKKKRIHASGNRRAAR